MYFHAPCGVVQCFVVCKLYANKEKEKKVANVIRRTISSGSPCLVDKISIICFERCLYLRSLLTDSV